MPQEAQLLCYLRTLQSYCRPVKKKHAPVEETHSTAYAGELPPTTGLAANTRPSRTTDERRHNSGGRDEQPTPRYPRRCNGTPTPSTRPTRRTTHIHAAFGAIHLDFTQLQRSMQDRHTYQHEPRTHAAGSWFPNFPRRPLPPLHFGAERRTYSRAAYAVAVYSSCNH